MEPEMAIFPPAVLTDDPRQDSSSSGGLAKRRLKPVLWFVNLDQRAISPLYVSCDYQHI
jgi:hypothetical protein